MIDDRNFGRDDGIKCVCGASTFLIDDQGGGLRSYLCDNPECDDVTTVQFEQSKDDYDEETF